MRVPAAKKKVLAVASGGGHWAQMLRVLSAFDTQEIVFVTADAGYLADRPTARFHVVPDANRWQKLSLLRLAVAMLRVLVRERPDVVFSTGAAPGLFAIIFGRLLGARTIWLDSVANVDEMSLSGRLARPFSSLSLTQWPELAQPGGPEYAGRVF
jgi:UDP-N-acetylglucosamine:LPS N-acetylglucosamine transferase